MPRQGVSVLREQTRQFIGENPTEVVLTRYTRSSDGAGGFTRTNPTPLPPQDVRLIVENRMVSVERKTVSGEMLRPEYNMLCEHDADVENGDTFVHRGMTMEVVFVHASTYELVAEVAVR